MALYLIHCTPSGEPVGIWDDTGAHLYAKPVFERRGQAVFDARGSQNPWSTFVEDLTHQPPHASMWKSEDSPLDQSQALDEARMEFSSLNKPPLR